MVDEDAPHHLRRDGKEVRAVLPRRALLIDEPQVGLVDQRGGLQRVAIALAPQPGRRALMQLPVDGRHQLVTGRDVAAGPRMEKPGHVAGPLLLVHAGHPAGGIRSSQDAPSAFCLLFLLDEQVFRALLASPQWRWAVAGWMALLLIVAAGQTPRQSPRIHLPDSRVDQQVRNAVLGAQARLGRPDCQLLLTDFQDAEGRLLLEQLQETNLSPAGYLLDRIWFVDGGDTPQCQRDSRMAAFTVPGHKVIRVCTNRFGKSFARQEKAAEMIVIHEMLHTLGLGENPPSSREITEQVTRRCGAS